MLYKKFTLKSWAILIIVLWIISISHQAIAQRLTYTPNHSQVDITKELTINPHSASVKKALPDDETSRQKIEGKPWFISKYQIAVGGFFPVNNAKIKVGNSTASTEIDFEDDLNMKKSSQTFTMGAEVHLGKRHRLELVYFRFHRDASSTLDREINFNDSIYAINTNVSAFFKVDMFRFAYGYAFISNPKIEAGLSLGAHIMDTSVGLSAQGASQGFDITNDYGFTAPLPDIGIWGGYAFSPKWAVTAEFDFFSLKVDNIKGRIIGGNIFVKYKIIEPLLVSAGYSGFNIRVDVDRERADGFLKWGYNGPSISAAYRFGPIGKGPGSK